MSLGWPRHSGEKLWLLLCMFTTGSPLLLCQTVYPMSYSLGTSQMSPCFASGAVLLMSWFRRTSGYKAWKFYCPESKKVIISERADFDERFSSIRGILHPRFHPLVLNLSWNPPLSLFIFQTSLMTLQSIPVTHSCLFMGGTVLVLLNNHLLAP